MDERAVAPRGERGRDQEPDDERDGEPPARRRRLRHRPSAGGDEQGDEHAQADEVAQREVDDPRQPVDERVADREQPVDAARRQPGEEDLEATGSPAGRAAATRDGS